MSIIKNLLYRNNPPSDPSFKIPVDGTQPPVPAVFCTTLPPEAIRPPRGKMTRRKRVRLRKKYNRLRRLARIGKVRLVIRSFMHGTVIMKEQKRWYDLGHERRELTDAEAAQFPEAEEVTCPECLYELEHGEAVPEGVIHSCDTMLNELEKSDR